LGSKPYAVYILTTGYWTLLRHAIRQSRPVLTIAKGRSSQGIAKGFPQWHKSHIRPAKCLFSATLYSPPPLLNNRNAGNGERHQVF